MYTTKNFAMPRVMGSFIEDLFQNGKVWTDELWNEDRMHVPVNIKETDAAYELSVVAPGLSKEAFKVNVEKNVLTISYEHKEDSKEQDGKVLRAEYRVKSFKRSFTLNEKVNVAAINAKYNDGVLLVTLPKKETAEPTTQNISVA